MILYEINNLTLSFLIFSYYIISCFEHLIMRHGAGILLIEKYDNDYFFLFVGNTKKNVYEDPGGKRDHGESPEETAVRECREETLNLINIFPKELKILGKPHKIGNYVSFFLFVSGLHLEYHKINQFITKKNCSDSSWKEMDNIVRLPVEYFFDPKNSENIDNNGHTIRNRTQKIVYKHTTAIKKIIKTDKPFKLIKRTTIDDSNCTNNTISFGIMGITELTQNQIFDKLEILVVPQFSNNEYNSLGIYINLCTISDNYEKIVQKIKNASFSGRLPWKIDQKIDNRFKFKSDLLKKIEKYLTNNNSRKIYSLSMPKKYPNDILNCIFAAKWSYSIIGNVPNSRILIKKYPVTIG